jgi:uncharacterized protein (DUF169 family)
MTDYRALEQQLASTLGLQRRPVAISFRNTVPDDLPRFEGTAPSGCTFWRIAAEGRAFYTVPSDHWNCAVGAYTHNLPLPPEREHELGQTLALMGDIGYLRMEEVPGIPRVRETPAAIVYAPLGESPFDPDVVVFAGPPGRVMLLQEAAIRAGVAAQLNMLGRPTCMAVPAAQAMGMVASTGCVGNRVYTSLDEADLYAMVPGAALDTIAAESVTIGSANAALLAYHTSRKRELLSGPASAEADGR